MKSLASNYSTPPSRKHYDGLVVRLQFDKRLIRPTSQ